VTTAGVAAKKAVSRLTRPIRRRTVRTLDRVGGQTRDAAPGAGIVHLEVRAPA
jgi:hypothetical protein